MIIISLPLVLLSSTILHIVIVIVSPNSGELLLLHGRIRKEYSKKLDVHNGPLQQLSFPSIFDST
jgi:hypothetical protein